MSTNPIPWRLLATWMCRACGDCCKNYTPILTIAEGTRFSRMFGSVVGSCIRGFYIKKSLNGRCLFQYNLGSMWLCGIQDVKPSACKIWPFKILKYPKYGKAEEAIYNYKNKDLYVYVDQECHGIEYGRPSLELMDKVIPEFIEVSLEGGNLQFYSTNYGASEIITPTKYVLTIL